MQHNDDDYILEQIKKHIAGLGLNGKKDAHKIGRIFQDVSNNWRVEASTQAIKRDGDAVWDILLPMKIKSEALTNSNVNLVVARFVPVMRDILMRIAPSLTDEKLKTIPIFKDNSPEELEGVRTAIAGGYLYNVVLGLANRLAEIPTFDRDKDLSVLNVTKLLGGIANTPTCVDTITNSQLSNQQAGELLVTAIKNRTDGKYNKMFNDIEQLTGERAAQHKSSVQDRVNDPDRVARLAERAAAIKAAATQKQGGPQRKAKTAPVGTGPFGLPVRGEHDAPTKGRSMSQGAQIMKGLGGSSAGRKIIAEKNAKAERQPSSPPPSPPQQGTSNDNTVDNKPPSPSGNRRGSK